MDETGQLKRALIDASAGAIAGAISRTVTSPLDVIKIRFQVVSSHIFGLFIVKCMFAVYI